MFYLCRQILNCNWLTDQQHVQKQRNNQSIKNFNVNKIKSAFTMALQFGSKFRQSSILRCWIFALNIYVLFWMASHCHFTPIGARDVVLSLLVKLCDHTLQKVATVERQGWGENKAGAAQEARTQNTHILKTHTQIQNVQRHVKTDQKQKEAYAQKEEKER